MNTRTRHIGTFVAAMALGGAVAFAPIAAAEPVHVPVGPADIQPGPVGGAGTDPLVPNGTLPVAPWTVGYVNPDHDNGDTTNGAVDLPF
jgi:hypothetical protein